ncbi:o-succinylbenzoate--CoA ligase [Sansalvadorimonas verongulae]|uniref:o-succinylbenzoate--CoA ligase n=1 Tax=Sansalvadorimonas verongulae TaxID=2172824 RepID=UPI0012BBAA4B|nr:o-succinylbenzoate--CoA ligase [Sansalvadorimonas verongulae]MTI12807.1 o-succinylbenzoate--CoA ligase [Sansalvadorimonas verongulae]
MNSSTLSGPATNPDHTYQDQTPRADQCPLEWQVSHNPDGLAIMAGELYWTWQELERRVQTMACGLRAHGLSGGDVLALSCANSPMQMVLILACLRVGIVVLPLNPRFPEEKVRSALELAGASGFWSDDLSVSGWDGITLPDSLHKLEGEPQTFTWDDSRVCTLVMTSGSSGFPRMVAHCFANHRASALASGKVIPLGVGDSWLLSLPLFHIGGLATMFRCLLSGAAIVFPDHRSNLAQTLIKRQVTHVSMVNTQLFRLLKTEGFAFEKSAVRYLLMGGGYVSGALAEQCQREGVTVLTSYGMTEMGSQICTGEPVFLASGALTSGKPLSHCEVHIADDGEVQVRGQSLFCGYWKQGELTRHLNDNGWFCTGDTGLWLGDKIQINGRIDSQFISGGENIQPEAIERILLEISGIEQAVVVPVPHLEYGQRPVAFIKGADCQQKALWQSHIRNRLPGFMVPDQFLPWPNAGKGSQLKVNRRELEQLALKLQAETCRQEDVHRVSGPVLEQTMIDNSNAAVSADDDGAGQSDASPGTSRAFIAFMLPLDLAAAVHKKVRRFGPSSDTRRIRWTPPQNFHLTLRFLGESTPEQLQIVADELRIRLSDFQRFVCMSGGVEYLPNHNHPRVMTLKIHSGRRMEDLHSLCEEVASKAGFGPDNRLFRPHVTLARTQDTGKRDTYAAFTVPWRLPGYRLQVGEVALVSSELSHDGSRYQILESFPLA